MTEVRVYISLLHELHCLLLLYSVQVHTGQRILQWLLKNWLLWIKYLDSINENILYFNNTLLNLRFITFKRNWISDIEKCRQNSQLVLWLLLQCEHQVSSHFKSVKQSRRNSQLIILDRLWIGLYLYSCVRLMLEI